MQTEESTRSAGTRSSSKSLGWGLALLVVAVAWTAAIALRGGGRPVALDGWVDGFEAGQTRAAEVDRPMIVLFTADWCSPCQQFKQEVLKSAKVAAQLEAGFVPVVIDLTEQSSTNPNMETAMRYQVNGIPTVIALSPSGEQIARFVGDRSVSGFTDWLNQLGK